MEAPGRKHYFTEEVLKFRCSPHQFGKREKCQARIFRRDQIRNDIGDAAIVFRCQQALGAKQIVVEKSTVRKGAAHIDKESKQLSVIQRSPGGQRDLKGSEPRLVSVGNPLTNRLL